jgi:uncharacterized membrane protein
MKVATSIVIHQPIERVFAFVTDVEKHPQWVPGSLENSITSTGEIRIGTTMHHVGQFLGRRIESDIEVTQYETNRMFAYKSISGALPYEMLYRFESVEHGTRVDLIAEGETSAFFKLAEPLINSASKRHIVSAMNILKERLEDLDSMK